MSRFIFSRQNILVSYAYLRKNKYMQELVIACSPYVDFLLDSGAFTDRWSTFRSHASSGVYSPISLEEYMKFCHRVKSDIWQYIALDVIRNPKRTKENLSDMVKDGLKPMPVFVEGFTTSELGNLLSVNDRLCVAGAIGADIAYVHKRYQDVFDASGGTAKIHALGYGRYPEMKHAAISTADSSSATTGERYGAVFIFDEIHGMKSTNYRKLSASKGGAESPQSRYLHYMQEKLGVSVERLTDRNFFISKEKYSIPTAVSYYSYMMMAENVKSSRKKPKNYFSAITIPKALLTIASIVKNTTANGIDYEAFRRDCHENHGNSEKQVEFIVEAFRKSTNWKTPNHA